MAELTSLESACQQVVDWTRAKAPIVQPLWDALDTILAETVSGGSDVPAYDKALVDGFAVVASDFQNVPSGRAVSLEVVETVYAGQVPTHLVFPGQATRIMTGAPLPEGADAVVMVETTREHAARSVDDSSSQRVEVYSSDVRSGQHVLHRGAVYQAGQSVMKAGQLIRPVEIGVLAELGYDRVKVVPPPTVMLIQTGDELVEVAETPGPGQIRNSNGPMLEAMARRCGAEVRNLGIVRDTPAALQEAVVAGLSADVLVLSGGVSQGDKDLVPAILRDAGVQCVFHKVAVRPGKPLWFGVKDVSQRRALVFGLPGNPVSGLVGFHLFVALALRRLMGYEESRQSVRAKLAERFVLTGKRPAFWPGRLAADAPEIEEAYQEEASARVTPLPWMGSSDPFTLVGANCLIHFPIGDHDYAAGAGVECLPLDNLL